RIAAVAGHEKIEVAIVVEVGDGDARAPTFARKPGLFGDVGELEAGILMPECDEKIAALLVAIDGRAVHHYDIELAVIVAVEQADAAAHGFDHIVFFTRGDVGGGQASLGRNLAKDWNGSSEFGRRRFLVNARWVPYRALRRSLGRQQSGEGDQQNGNLAGPHAL